LQGFHVGRRHALAADTPLAARDFVDNIDTRPMPRQRSTIQFIFVDLAPQRRNWWLIVDSEHSVDLCSVDPGFDVDLYLATDLRTMTEIWMGFASIATTRDDGRLMITGSKTLEAALKSWLALSPFAKVERMVA
jgi:hypothetical protein